LLLSGLSSAPLPAAPEPKTRAPETKEDIKALYVYNFVKYTEWPKDREPAAQAPPSELRVGVVTDDQTMYQAMGRMLQSLQVGGRPLVVEKYRSDPTEPYQVLFFSKARDWRQILDSVQEAPVLTIADGIGGFSEEFGMIELTESRGKIRFSINDAVAKAASLTIDPRLLRMAEVVKTREGRTRAGDDSAALRTGG
jgi:hypothetical protein